MTDPTPPHWRAPSGTCPHCATASLAAAWQAGAEKTGEKMQARIEALEAERDRLKVERDKYASALDDIADGLGETDVGAIGRFAPAVARAALKGEGDSAPAAKEAAMGYLTSAGQAYDRSGWQPIETAPKSRVEDDCSFGPIIALASTSAHRALGYWSNGEGARPAGWVNPHDHRVMEYWNAFTHWMPLPPLHGEDTAP